jgi:predicted nuclease with TOPRIM domain
MSNQDIESVKEYIKSLEQVQKRYIEELESRNQQLQDRLETVESENVILQNNVKELREKIYENHRKHNLEQNVKNSLHDMLKQSNTTSGGSWKIKLPDTTTYFNDTTIGGY